MPLMAHTLLSQGWRCQYAHELLEHSNQVSLKELSECNHYTFLDAVFGEKGYWLSHVASLNTN